MTKSWKGKGRIINYVDKLCIDLSCTQPGGIRYTVVVRWIAGQQIKPSIQRMHQGHDS